MHANIALAVVLCGVPVATAEEQTFLSTLRCVQTSAGKGRCTGNVCAKAMAPSWMQRAPLERPTGGRLGCACPSNYPWRDLEQPQASLQPQFEKPAEACFVGVDKPLSLFQELICLCLVSSHARLLCREAYRLWERELGRYNGPDQLPKRAAALWRKLETWFRANIPSIADTLQ